MMRGEHIEDLAAAAYASGITPLDVAESIITVIAEEATGCRRCSVLLARKVIAGLLDAGWAMPDGTSQR